MKIHTTAVGGKELILEIPDEVINVMEQMGTTHYRNVGQAQDVYYHLPQWFLKEDHSDGDDKVYVWYMIYPKDLPNDIKAMHGIQQGGDSAESGERIEEVRG